MVGTDFTIPTLGEIRDIPWNGYTVASTFSGGGGSSLGYRMAGFRVVYANEFVPAARVVYAANCGTHTYVDGRDIRDVTPENVLQLSGLQRGELDILDGSPPCSAFSYVGSREKGWGKVKRYSDKTQRVDDLFYEYARLLDGIQPKVFIAENVAALARGKAKGYFNEIHKRLSACGYKVSARVLNAAWLGVPQNRNRLIFIGVREDLGVAPTHPTPVKRQVSILESGALNCIPKGWALCYGKQHWKGWKKGLIDTGCPSPCVLSRYCSLDGVECFVWDGHQGYSHIPEEYARVVCTFPQDYNTDGLTKQQRWERYGRAVPPLMMRAIAERVRDGILCKIA